MVTLTRSRDFDRVFRRGNSASSPEIVLYAWKRTRRDRAVEVRVAFCVGKKFGGAVERNRVRRRLREIFRKHQRELEQQWDLILLARQGAARVQFAKLEERFLSLCQKMKLLKPLPLKAEEQTEKLQPLP